MERKKLGESGEKMDFKQLEYITKIAEEGNMTKAAKKLYITQSALNQQLLKLERELGGALFIRDKEKLIPTAIGEIYLKNAIEILEIKKNTYNEIDEILNKNNEKIVIGLTPDRGMKMFTSIYPEIHKLYPNIIIEPLELSVEEQHKMLEIGKIDFGFVNLENSQKKNYKYSLLRKEKLMLVVPSSIVGKLLNSKNKKSEQTELKKLNLKRLNIEDLQNQDFVLLSKGTTIRNIIDKYFIENEINPKILFETKSSEALIDMVKNNTACTIVSEIYKKNIKGIKYFSILENLELEYCIVYKKREYLTTPMKKLIELSKKYWDK